MIKFGFRTYKAEINAMPCPPDEFHIIFTSRDVIYFSNIVINEYGREIMERFASDYHCTYGELKHDGSRFIHFKRFARPKPQLSIQDLILNTMNHN